ADRPERARLGQEVEDLLRRPAGGGGLLVGGAEPGGEPAARGGRGRVGRDDVGAVVVGAGAVRVLRPGPQAGGGGGGGGRVLDGVGVGRRGRLGGVALGQGARDPGGAGPEEDAGPRLLEHARRGDRDDLGGRGDLRVRDGELG